MRKLHLSFLVALCAFTAWALPAIPEVLNREEAIQAAKKVTRAIAPDANTLTVSERIYSVYAADGSGTTWLEFWTKAMTEAGADDLRTFPLHFQKGFSESEFQLAEILRKDGSVETVDLAANIKVATSNSSNAENIYDENSKRMVLTLPHLEVGDTLHLVLAYHTIRPRIPDTYSSVYTFENTSEPVLNSSACIIAPKELPLRSIAILNEVPGTMSSKQEKLSDGRVKYTWEARNVPQTFEEPNMPELRTQLQRVAVSSFGSWEEVSKWYWDLCVPHMEMTPAIKAKVTELTEGKSREEQIDALFGFVAQSIRYMGIIAEDKAPGYEPHDIALTFDNRYGVCRDKGVLLVAMLREAGINAFPVLINAGSQLDKEVPLAHFNHAIVAIDNGDRDYRLIDPTDDTARAEMPAYLSGCTYLVTRPEGDDLRISPIPSATTNLMDITTAGDLDAAGNLDLTVNLAFSGLNDNAYRPMIVKNTMERLRNGFDGLVKRAVSGAELTHLSYTPENPQDISKPLTVTLKIRVPGYAVPNAEGHTVVDFPFFSRVFGVVNFLFDGLDQPERKYDWEIESPCAVQEKVVLRGFDTLGEPTLLPGGPVLHTSGAAYDLTCVRGEDGTLTLTRNLRLTQKVYTPANYRALRRFRERLLRSESIRPLFVQTPGKSDDAIVLFKSSETTVGEDGSVTSRFVTDTKVLTFQGKRALGEAKLYHNPSWQSLTLNAAEVTTATGDRVSVTEKELNHLDVDGAASAPRYTMAKEMVVSLPAVDVNTVTHVDWQVTSRDTRPFTESVTFAAGYPVEKQVYTLTVPLAMDADLRIAERNFEGADIVRTVTKTETAVTRTWTATNLAPIRREPGMPAPALFRPTLYISTRQAAAHRTLPQIIAKADGQIETGSEQAETIAEELTDDLESDEEKIRAIQVYLAQRVRTLGPAWTGLAFGTFTDPDKTLADGYGNRMDKLLLHMAMLRAADIDCDLVFASDSSIAAAYAFRDRIAARDAPRWTRWTLPYIRLADGRLVGDEGEFDEPGSTLVTTRSLMTSTGRVLYNQPEELRSRTESTVRIVVDKLGNAVISSATDAWGLQAGALRQSERDFTPEIRRRAVAAMADSITSGATPVSEYVVNTGAYPVRSRLAVEAKNYAQRQGNLFSIPVRNLVSPLYALRGANRQNPILQDEVSGSAATVDIWLPKGSEIVSKPEPFTYALPAGGMYRLSVEQQIVPHSGMVRLTYRTEFSSSPAVLESWMAPALMELDSRLQAPVMKTLIIRIPE